MPRRNADEKQTLPTVGFQLSLVIILCAKMYVNIDLECVRVIHAGDVHVYMAQEFLHGRMEQPSVRAS